MSPFLLAVRSAGIGVEAAETALIDAAGGRSADGEFGVDVLIRRFDRWDGCNGIDDLYEKPEIWDTTTGEKVATLANRVFTRNLTFTPDGTKDEADHCG